jgi:hypothetical protein
MLSVVMLSVAYFYYYAEYRGDLRTALTITLCTSEVFVTLGTSG